jgi:uncharacterized protein YceK
MKTILLVVVVLVLLSGCYTFITDSLWSPDETYYPGAVVYTHNHAYIATSFGLSAQRNNNHYPPKSPLWWIDKGPVKAAQ